jgi:DNA-binding HxlR family transcriptional regulator
MSQEILELIKALAHQRRFTIITQLNTTPLTFKELKKRTALEKSTLANHLHRLLNVGLIEKIQHGVYQITHDGRILLATLETYHKHSKERKRQAQIAETQRLMMKSFLERGTRRKSRRTRAG